jgi:hypothetical protein
MAKYRRASIVPWLALFHARGDESSPIHEVHFHARAWQLASEKERELGWSDNPTAAEACPEAVSFPSTAFAISAKSGSGRAF